MCLRVAERSEADADRSLRQSIRLVEPALIVLFGAVVGFIALAMLQAIYGINAGVLP
jgi:general secretion pathway protein F